MQFLALQSQSVDQLIQDSVTDFLLGPSSGAPGNEARTENVLSHPEPHLWIQECTTPSHREVHIWGQISAALFTSRWSCCGRTVWAGGAMSPGGHFSGTLHPTLIFVAWGQVCRAGASFFTSSPPKRKQPLQPGLPLTTLLRSLPRTCQLGRSDPGWELGESQGQGEPACLSALAPSERLTFDIQKGTCI